MIIISFSYDINRRNRQIECFNKTNLKLKISGSVENVKHLRSFYFVYNKHKIYKEKLKSTKLAIFRVFSLF